MIQFFYVNNKGLACIFPKDFESEVPEHAIVLAMTCVCILFSAMLYEFTMSLHSLDSKLPRRVGELCTQED
jgi:hypothetical protein